MNGYHAHAEATDLAALASLLADDTRASFCLALLDGRAWTASFWWFLGTIIAFTAARLILVAAGVPRTRVRLFQPRPQARPLEAIGPGIVSRGRAGSGNERHSVE